MRSTNRSERVQVRGGNSGTSVPQPPDIIPLKEVEKHAILAAVKQLGIQGAALALGIGKTTIHRKLREWQYDRRESESGWRTVPITKLNTLVSAAAKATEFLKWCQGTMAPRLGEQLDAAIQELQDVANRGTVQKRQSR
jgi:Bacterial regulatory protein, Fis family